MTSQEDLDPKAAIYALWGELNPEEHTSVHTHVSINHLTAMCERRVTLSIKFDSEVRVIGGYRYVLETKEAVGFEDILDMELTMGEPRFIYINSLKKILKTLGPDLYEYDPRLGIFLKDHNGRLPRCPLFDPFPLPYPKWEVRDWSTNIPNETPCPLCGKDFAAHDKPMWGGGNVCWVHAKCWGQGLNQEGENILTHNINPLTYLTVT